MLLASSALFVAMTSISVQSRERDTEAKVVAACDEWMRSLDVNSAATAQLTQDGGLCINGFIDPETDEAILNQLKSIREDSLLVVVIRSGGGDFDATMNVAEALQRRRSTVIAETVCASGCANYIIAAGKRRIVRDNSFLVFHGGVVPRLVDQARLQIEAIAKNDPKVDIPSAIAKMQAMIDLQITRQNAFMIRAGVKPEIFAWMDEANTPAAAKNVEHCPPDSNVMQYSQAVLARFGLTFDYYGSPQSQDAVDALLKKLGRSSKVCYWVE